MLPLFLTFGIAGGEISFQGRRGTLDWLDWMDAIDVSEWARFFSERKRVRMRKIRCIRELQESGFDVQLIVGVL